MRFRCIACDVLARPVYLAAAHSPHIVDVTLERFGLHIKPSELRQILQVHVDTVSQEDIYDAVLLAYGLCGMATNGLRAGAVPLVIPRAHDCITLFLGGRDRYEQEFNNCPGTYWYVQDFVERGDSEEIPLSIGAVTAEKIENQYAEFVEKFGADNAAYLMEMMGAWQAHYERGAFIDMAVDGGEHVAARAQEDAQRHGWRYERLLGDMILIKRLLEGDWDQKDFLVLQPGQQIEMVGGEKIVRASG